MSDKTLRFASLGTSSIMNVMQEALRLTPGVECALICSRDKIRARDYAQKVGVAEYSGSYEDALNRNDIDAVYIATPSSLHVQHALQALSHGKHVVLEKPASLDMAGIQAMKEMADKNGVFCFEAITTIFMPNFIALKKMLPDLGRILHVRISYGQYSSKLQEYLQGKIPSNLDPQLGGGALNDMGIYCIHSAIDLFGAPDQIHYTPVYGPNDADIEGVLTLQYHTYPAHLSTNGIPAAEDSYTLAQEGLTLHLSTCKNRSNGSGLYIEGTNGYFEENGPLNAFASCRAAVGAKEGAVNEQPDCNRMLYEVAAFRDAINSHDESFHQRMYVQSLEAARVLEMAHKTMRF